jgi:hypothetical protein
MLVVQPFQPLRLAYLQAATLPLPRVHRLFAFVVSCTPNVPNIH